MGYNGLEIKIKFKKCLCMKVFRTCMFHLPHSEMQFKPMMPILLTKVASCISWVNFAAPQMHPNTETCMWCYRMQLTAYIMNNQQLHLQTICVSTYPQTHDNIFVIEVGIFRWTAALVPTSLLLASGRLLQVKTLWFVSKPLSKIEFVHLSWYYLLHTSLSFIDKQIYLT